MKDVSRRAALRKFGVAASGLTAASFTTGMLVPQLAQAQAASGGPDANTPQVWPGVLSVRDFGAVGDGTADDTAAFQKAIDEASGMGGNIVFVPRGDYRIEGTLTIKRDVTLQGVFGGPTIRTQYKGSSLLAYHGRGQEEGEPFIRLHENGTLRGLSIFYPEQKIDDLQPYPWTLYADGVNISIVDVLLVNPWRAVDLRDQGRGYVNRLFAHPLVEGISIDKCYDVGRIENVHFWPFWEDNLKLHDFTANNLTSFTIGKTDWHYLSNCFTIFPKVGFHFVKTEAGEANAMLTTCGSDVGPLAVLVDEVMPHAGVSFVNSQMMASVEINDTNRGPLKFTGCGFWGVDQRGSDRFGFGDRATRSHAVIRGTGHVTFSACHFNNWNKQDKDDPCIHALSGGLTVNACEFMEPHRSIVLEKDVEAAIVVGNRFIKDAPEIENHMEPELAQIGFNVRAIRSGRRQRRA